MRRGCLLHLIPSPLLLRRLNGCRSNLASLVGPFFAHVTCFRRPRLARSTPLGGRFLLLTERHQRLMEVRRELYCDLQRFKDEGRKVQTGTFPVGARVGGVCGKINPSEWFVAPDIRKHRWKAATLGAWLLQTDVAS